MSSVADVTVANMEISPSRVTWNAVDLGGTLGNVVVSTKYEKSEIKADQYGNEVLDRRISGLLVTVTTELAEPRLKDTWAVVFPNASLVVDGGDPTKKALDFTSNITDADTDFAKVLLLHPLREDDAVLDYDYTFYLAIASAESEVTLGPTEQMRLKIVWNILPDFTTNPPRYYRHGDPATAP